MNNKKLLNKIKTNDEWQEIYDSLFREYENYVLKSEADNENNARRNVLARNEIRRQARKIKKIGG